MARKQNIHSVTHEGQAFKRTSATRTYQFLVVGKRSYLDALSRAGRMDKTDGDNYDYWQRREPAKVEGFVSREDYQRSEEHTSELQSLMRISYAVFCLKKKKQLTLHHLAHLSSDTNATHQKSYTYYTIHTLTQTTRHKQSNKTTYTNR